MTKLKSKHIDVISVYRSKEAKSNFVTKALDELIDIGRDTVITGDFNICFKADKKHKIIETLEIQGFKQFVNEATHIKGGTIDHMYSNIVSDKMDVTLYSPYYCAHDHDALLSVVSV